MSENNDRTYRLEISLTQDQRDLLIGALGKELDWHHSENRPELAREYRNLLEELRDSIEEQ